MTGTVSTPESHGGHIKTKEERLPSGMFLRRNLCVSGFVAASLVDVFVSLAFTGRFHVAEWSVFAVFFLIVFAGFERFPNRVETLE